MQREKGYDERYISQIPAIGSVTKIRLSVIYRLTKRIGCVRIFMMYYYGRF